MESYNYRRNNGAVWPKVAGEGEETRVTNKIAGTEGNLELKPYKGASLILGSEYKNFDYEQEDLDAAGPNFQFLF